MAWSTMRKQLLTATFIVLSFNAWGASIWNTNVWGNIRLPVQGVSIYGIETNDFGMDTNGVVVVTNVYYIAITFERVSTNQTLISVKARAPEWKALECISAVNERLQATDGTTEGAAEGTPVRFYRLERANLVSLKTWINNECSRFIDLSQANGSGAFEGYTGTIAGSGWGTIPFPTWSATSLCINVGLPTNYLNYTPWRDLSGYGVGKENVITTTWDIITADTGAVSFTTLDSWGNEHTFTATNGQVVTTNAVNGNIEPGYTHLDYGWRGMTNLFRNLVWVGYRAVYGEGGVANITEYTADENTNTSWAAAKTLAEANVQTNAISQSGFRDFDVWTQGDYSQPGETNWRGRAEYKGIKVQTLDDRFGEVNTNMTLYCDIDSYIRVDAYGTFDAYGVTGLSTNMQEWSRVDTATDITIVDGELTSDALRPATFPSPWCDEPTSGDTPTKRGFESVQSPFPAIIIGKFNGVANSFLYY